MATVTYFFYAFMEDGKCVDVERTRTQKTGDALENYVEITVNEYNACMDDDATSPYYIIGKSWNGESWYVDNTHYYAIINEKLICVNFATSYKEIADKAYVPITRTEYENLIPYHKKYDPDMNVFYEVTFPQYADADTTMISVNGKDVALQDVIESLQNAIENAGNSLDANTIISMIKGVDGAGSELDADTIDGFDSSYFVSKQDLAGYATKADVQGVAKTSDLAKYATVDSLANYATIGSLNGFASATDVQSVRNAINNIKSTEFEIGTVIKARGYRGAYTETLGFRPKAVLVMPIDGNMYVDGIQRGGLYIDDGNDYSRQGGAITNDGFQLYAYEEDGNDLLGGVHLYIAFK